MEEEKNVYTTCARARVCEWHHRKLTKKIVPYLPSLNFVDKSTQFASRAISGDSARLVYTRSAPRAGSPFAGSLVSHPPQPALLPSSGLASPLTAPPTLDQAALWVI